MARHWVEYLPEVGKSIMRRGDEEQDKKDRLVGLQRQAEQLKKEIEEDQNDLIKICRLNWSVEEIAEAKRKEKSHRDKIL